MNTRLSYLVLGLMLVAAGSIHSRQSDAQQVVDDILELYTAAADADYFGEPVSQLEHALQCAQQAVDAQADQETIIAALLHDIGHLCAAQDAPAMEGYGTLYHEVIGADYVRKRGFSERVAQLIKGHVQAKRYLTYRYPEYYEKLSDASKQTLTYQGGRMTADEAAAFEADPLFEQKLRMRFWDEQAKHAHWHGAPLSSYREVMLKHLECSN